MNWVFPLSQYPSSLIDFAMFLFHWYVLESCHPIFFFFFPIFYIYIYRFILSSLYIFFVPPYPLALVIHSTMKKPSSNPALLYICCSRPNSIPSVSPTSLSSHSSTSLSSFLLHFPLSSSLSYFTTPFVPFSLCPHFQPSPLPV